MKAKRGPKEIDLSGFMLYRTESHPRRAWVILFMIVQWSLIALLVLRVLSS